MDAKPIAMSVEQFKEFIQMWNTEPLMMVTDGVKLHIHVHVGADAALGSQFLRTPTGRQVKGGDDSEGLGTSLRDDGVDVDDKDIEWFDAVTGSFGKANPSEPVDRQVTEGTDGSSTTTEEEDRSK